MVAKKSCLECYYHLGSKMTDDVNDKERLRCCFQHEVSDKPFDCGMFTNPEEMDVWKERQKRLKAKK